MRGNSDTLHTCYQAFPDRTPHPLEAMYVKHFAGIKATRQDLDVANGCTEMAILCFDGMMEKREAGAYLPAEALCCLVCYALLVKPWTLACGHTLCATCWGKLKKCPLPGASCRDAPSFVMLTAAGNVASQPARAKPGRRGDVTATMNLTLKKMMQWAFPKEEEVAKFKAEANAELSAGNAAGAECIYKVALRLSPNNHVLYGNCAQAHLNQGDFGEALKMATVCAVQSPRWHKAHFRRGTALQGLKQYLFALAAFARCAGLIEKNISDTGGYGATRKDLRYVERACVRARKRAGEQEREQTSEKRADERERERQESDRRATATATATMASSVAASSLRRRARLPERLSPRHPCLAALPPPHRRCHLQQKLM